jgi:hypothetical protein
MASEMRTRWLKVICFSALINAGLFILVAVCIGGDALSGKVAGGRYYLANHGSLTEVSYPVFVYSKIHAFSVFIMLPVAVFARFLWWGLDRRAKAQKAP